MENLDKFKKLVLESTDEDNKALATKFKDVANDFLVLFFRKYVDNEFASNFCSVMTTIRDSSDPGITELRDIIGVNVGSFLVELSFTDKPNSTLLFFKNFHNVPERSVPYVSDPLSQGLDFLKSHLPIPVSLLGDTRYVLVFDETAKSFALAYEEDRTKIASWLNKETLSILGSVVIGLSRRFPQTETAFSFFDQDNRQEFYYDVCRILRLIDDETWLTFADYCASTVLHDSI